MTTQAIGRSKHWWLWPDFNEEKDARDAAKMGVTACGLIAAVTGVTFYYRYMQDGEISQLLGGMVVLILYSIFGFGILKMSRIAVTLAMLLFIAEKGYTYLVEHKPLGIAILLAWYLVQSARAIYWFREEMGKIKEENNI